MDGESYTRRLDPHAFLLLMNGAPRDVAFVLPDSGSERTWQRLIDTARDGDAPKARFTPGSEFPLAAHALALFVSEA
jgi:glycogen operon protein